VAVDEVDREMAGRERLLPIPYDQDGPADVAAEPGEVVDADAIDATTPYLRPEHGNVSGNPGRYIQQECASLWLGRVVVDGSGGGASCLLRQCFPNRPSFL
jgi:hypothetical protein